MSKFLTIHEAAKRVGRSTRTMRRWTDNGLKLRGGLIREDELLEQDRLMRERLGRPRKAEPGAVTVTTVEELEALPINTLIQEHDGFKNLRHASGWMLCIFGATSPLEASAIGLPATVLYRPASVGSEGARR